MSVQTTDYVNRPMFLLFELLHDALVEGVAQVFHSGMPTWKHNWSTIVRELALRLGISDTSRGTGVKFVR